MLTSVKCPQCGHEVEISQALKHELEEKAVKELSVKHKKELEEAQTQAEAKALKRLSQQFEVQLKNSQEDLEDAQKRNKQLLDQLSETNKLIRELKKRDEERALEMEKKLSEYEEKIKIEATKQAEEKERLKLLEREKQLADALKVNEELKRKLQQGSQQTQGEVLELALENLLKSEFPNDEVSPIGKGVRGADILQKVWDRNGSCCGTILWETKNAKWNGEWIGKLREDQRREKADIAILVSEHLPSEIKDTSFKEGIWITKRSHFAALAVALRYNIIQAYHLKRSVAGKNDKMEVLYNYLSGIEFRQRVEAIVEAFTRMQEELEREKRWFAAKWSRSEKHLRMVIDHTLGMHGDLKGIMGSSIPEIKSLKSPGEQLDIS